MEYGDLESLHPNETYEEIKARRLSNWTIFKNACDNQDIVNVGSQRLEMYQPTNEKISIPNGKSLTIYGSSKDESNLVFYPFVPRLGTLYTFDIAYGGTLRYRNSLAKCAGRLNLFESYNCVLKKSAAPRVIEILGTTRADFWDSLEVGQTVFYSWQYTVLGKTNTIASFDDVAKTITLSTDIDAAVTDDKTGDEVWFGTDFREEVALSDYTTYGRNWIRGQSSQLGYMLWYFIHTLPVASTGALTTIELDNCGIQNWNANVDISSGNFACIIRGTVNIDYGEICFAAFSRSQIAGQYIGGPTKEQTGGILTITGAGLRAVGSLDFYTAGNIYGSGTYIHPTIIVNLQQFIGRDNLASTFRMFSSTIEEVTGYDSWIGDFNCENSVELDLTTPNSQTLTIDTYYGQGALWISGNFIVTESAEWGTIQCSPQSEPPSGVDTQIVINNGIGHGLITLNWKANRADGQTIIFNNLILYAQPASEILSMIKADTDGAAVKKIQFNGVQYLKPDGSTIQTYVPGEAIPVGDSCASFIRPVRFMDIEINDLVTDYMVGKFLEGSAVYRQPLNNKYFLSVNDSEINLSQLFSVAYTTNTVFLTDQIRGARSTFQSLGFAGLAYNLPLQLAPAIASIAKQILVASQTFTNTVGGFSVSNVLEIDLGHNEYFVDAGTIKHIAPTSWSGTSKYSASSAFEGEIIIHAVGGDVVIQKWDASTNEYGNITEDITILSGTSKTLVCDRKNVLSKSANSTATPTLATGNGTVKEYKGVLPNVLLVKDAGFEITAGSINGSADANGDITGAGIDPLSFVDYYTGTYYILFDENLGDTIDLDVQYDIYNDWRQTGTWSEQA